MPDREELRATAAQCVALAQSTTDPRTRAVLTIMAQKLYDMANRQSAEYELDQPPLSGPGGMLVQGWPLRQRGRRSRSA